MVGPCFFSRTLLISLLSLSACKAFSPNFAGIRRSPRLRYSADRDPTPDISYQKYSGDDEIPEDQLPVYQLSELKEQPFFDWPLTKSFPVKMAALYAGFYLLVCWPISGATFTQSGYFLQKVFAANVGALGVLLAFSLRLSSGWGYVGSRLISEYVEYEETGWYDGNVNKKSKEAFIRDKLLYEGEVEEVESLTKKVTLFLAVAWIASIGIFGVVASQKPMFNEYDARTLNELVIDEKLAEKAARASGGKPTYCNSRYYRAVAGGGQGCD